MEGRRKKREFSEEFKHQMVDLYNAGKPQVEIIREYDLTPSAFRNWEKRINATGSSRIVDNRTAPRDRTTYTLEKKSNSSRMENSCLKTGCADICSGRS